MNEITTVGVDLAEEVIMVCAGDAQGRTRYFKQMGFESFARWASKRNRRSAPRRRDALCVC